MPLPYGFDAEGWILYTNLCHVGVQYQSKNKLVCGRVFILLDIPHGSNR